jgi:crotonobetaine/carnitine-CoA ligase
MTFIVENLDSRGYRGEWIITSMLRERAERFGDELAVESRAGNLSYADLVTRAGQVAGLLQGLGVNAGDRVATMLPSGIDYLAAWHGILWRRAVDVPVNTEFKGMFLEHVLSDAQAETLIIDGQWVGRLKGLNLPHLRHVVVVGIQTDDVTAGHLVTHSFAEALQHAPAALSKGEERDTTYVIYTSGTTGSPKGAVHNNLSSVHYLIPFLEGMELTDDDVCYSMFPQFHTMGRSACATTAFWLGNRLVLRNGFSASGFWNDVRTTGATWMGFFGAVPLFLWQQEPSALDREHKLRRAVGASAPPEIFDAWEERFGVTLYEVFGMTELGVGTGLGKGLRKRGTLGRPCRQLELQIVDPHDNPVPPNIVGEAVWRPNFPDAIFQGYWNRPDATVEAWRSLWFHSGDAGYLDDEGFFVLSDRIKDSIRRRGENISSMFVEESVRRVSSIKTVPRTRSSSPRPAPRRRSCSRLSVPRARKSTCLLSSLCCVRPCRVMPSLVTCASSMSFPAPLPRGCASSCFARKA